MTDPEQLRDPVLRAVAEYWDDIQRRADPGQRERLAALIDGSAEADSDEARAALEDELLDILPPDHPVSELLRSGTMFDSGLSGRPEPDRADELRRLSRRLYPVDELTVSSVVSAISSAAPAVPPAASAAAGPPGGDFDRQVQARLLALPSLSADGSRNWAIDPGRGLIRLPRLDGSGQLPAFQFEPSGAPWPVVREINELLDAAGDPWGAACWWTGPHERLGVTPAELLGRGEDDLLRMAAKTVGEDY